MKRFFLKHSRLLGGLFIVIALIASNAGSAWAGMKYAALRAAPLSNSAPANIGFQIMGWTVYPLALALLALGLYLRSRKRP